MGKERDSLRADEKVEMRAWTPFIWSAMGTNVELNAIRFNSSSVSSQIINENNQIQTNTV